MAEIESLLLLISGGLLLRFSLTLTGQAWAKSHAQTVTFMILPVITYVITKTITGNIALSLGMIGALSIVRFRHPVKSALELVMYFDLITIGIATSVRTKWAIQLILCTVAIIFLVKITQLILKKFGRTFYNASCNEGHVNNMLEIFCSEKIESIEGSDYTTNILKNSETNETIYRMSFENRDQLQKFKEELSEQKNIKKINVIFN